MFSHHEAAPLPYGPDRIPPATQPADARPGDDTLRKAIDVCLRSHATAEAPPPEFAHLPDRAKRQAGRNTVSRKYRPLEQKALAFWARDNGLLLHNGSFTAKWKAGGSAGETENQTYLEPETQRWIKRNDLSYHGTYLDFFYRVKLHNRYFPEAPLTLDGFVVDDDQFGTKMLKPVFSQPHVSSEAGATPEEVEAHMTGLGFHKILGTQHDYINPETGVRVEDLHDENVLVDERGDLFVIDPVIYLDDEGKAARIAAAGPLVFESLAQRLIRQA